MALDARNGQNAVSGSVSPDIDGPRALRARSPRLGGPDRQENL